MIVTIIGISLLFTQCSDNSDESDNTMNDKVIVDSIKDDVSVVNKELSTSLSETYIKVEFFEGPLKGVYKFLPAGDSFTSGVGLSYQESNNRLQITGQELISDDSFSYVVNFQKFVDGEAEAGKENSSFSKNGDCFQFSVRDNKNVKEFERITLNVEACGNKISIDKTGATWKKGSIRERRGVQGNYTESITYKIMNDDGSNEELTGAVKISFLGVQSRAL